jgi:hypothetical protein
MTPSVATLGIFAKLNLQKQREILVVNAPKSFALVLKALTGVRVCTHPSAVKEVTFSLAFVSEQAEVDNLSKAIVIKATGDAMLWFAYPKGTSRRYTCEFNRDTGWDVLRASGFDSVRQVAIDEDWSALRFRRNEFINHRRR